MEFTGERFIPDSGLEEELQLEHWLRYRAVKPFLGGAAVLDAACGEGYGSALLAETAASVVGIDLSEECISHANMRYKADNLSFRRASIDSLPLPDCSVDVVTSFETIEHVDDQTQQSFVREIARVLRADGVLVISSPDRLVFTELLNHRSAHHAREFSREEFESFLREHFATVRIFSQQSEMVHSVRRADSRSLHALRQPAEGVALGKYLIAVCGGDGRAATMDIASCMFPSRPESAGDLKYLQRLFEENRSLRAAHEQCQQSLDSIKASLSWRATEPMRRLLHAFGRNSRRTGDPGCS